MENIDEALSRAEKHKADEDPVRLWQAKLAPVQTWAVKAKQDFNKEVAGLTPRIDQALMRLNRLAAVMGGPPGEPLGLWEELNRLRTGIPNGYQHIVDRIDALTASEVAQRVDMLDLQTSPSHPPGNSNHVAAALVRLERSLDRYAGSLEGSPA